MTDDIGEYILQGPEPLYDPAKGGLGYEIFRTLNLNKGKVAQNIISTGEVDTYDDLLQKSIQVALYLSRKQLRKDDIVCLFSENNSHCLIPLIAAKFVGLNYVSIEATIPEDDFLNVFDYLQPKIMFASEKNEEIVELCLRRTNFKGEIIILGKSIKFTNFSQLLKFSKELQAFEPVYIENVKDDAIIFLSSGTTGKPKGIRISHYSLLGNLFGIYKSLIQKGSFHFSNYSQKFDDTESPKFMFYAPMNWISRILFSLSMIFSGGAMIIGDIFEAKEAWQALDEYKPNILFLAPGQANELCLYASDKEPNTSLDIFLTGGGLVSKMHIQNMKKCFPASFSAQGYGQTENVGVITGFDIGNSAELEMQRNCPESCGRALSGIQIRIVDPDNETICGVGMQGELRVKSKFVMNGYYKMDSSLAFDSDGWFKTGDLAYYDQNQCIYIVDRIKDLLLYSLYNIRPSVIENILSQHPAVYESLVIGYPHCEDNEHPMGIVVLKDEYENNISQDEIITFVNDRVPSDRYKIRAGIKFVDNMLRTASGKLNKIKMKQLVITVQQ